MREKCEREGERRLERESELVRKVREGERRGAPGSAFRRTCSPWRSRRDFEAWRCRHTRLQRRLLSETNGSSSRQRLQIFEDIVKLWEAAPTKRSDNRRSSLYGCCLPFPFSFAAPPQWTQNLEALNLHRLLLRSFGYRPLSSAIVCYRRLSSVIVGYRRLS